jgi:hypothetical protein
MNYSFIPVVRASTQLNSPHHAACLISCFAQSPSAYKPDRSGTAAQITHTQNDETGPDRLQRGHPFGGQNSSQQGVVTRYPTEPQTLAGRQKKEMKRREKGDERLTTTTGFSAMDSAEGNWEPP